jgi:sugar (pentulose or hexulose) kinase
MPIPVTAIFDIGKTNKKFFLFDDALRQQHREYHKLPTVTDDDGFECDDLPALTHWIRDTVARIITDGKYTLQYLNFSTYGATLVHLDADGHPVTPLYNYLKPIPDEIVREFFHRYPEAENNIETASPSLGMLNAGLQLYWIKKSKPAVFARIRHTLHFPQYLSYLFTGVLASEPTSIGCHTRLWDYTHRRYHRWLIEEQLDHLFPATVHTTHTSQVTLHGQPVTVGVGIHDSSSALAAYMLRTQDPFALISTGTWSITLNPFTREPLTADELRRDCLNYMTIFGAPVKASRLFLGHELDHQLSRLNTVFGKAPQYYKQVDLNPAWVQLGAPETNTFYPETLNNPTLVQDLFPQDQWSPARYSTFEEAYHQVIWGLARLQVAAVRLALGNSPIHKLYLDGGFVGNDIFLKLLQQLLPTYSLEISQQPLGSAQGAALIVRSQNHAPAIA